MIISDIRMNQDKLEEFVRILLAEKYEILSEGSKINVKIEVREGVENIAVETKLVEKNTGNITEGTVLTFEKIGASYPDQAEVMAKTSLLKLFGKEKYYKWGALIGVRPTKIVRRFLNMGLSYGKIKEILKNIYFVSEEKIALLMDISERQEKYLNKDTIGIYIGIAFCPTKCSYCSFPAYLLKGRYRERYNEYIAALYREIKEIGKLTEELGLKINTIYIGGGTPSILSETEISNLLGTIVQNYNLGYLEEFTFEAGRIDTLNKEKLEIIKSYGVNKISINPQSFNEKTLRLVNRYHDKEQFDNIYNISKELGLGINMDLIIGLPGEDTEDIMNTLREVSRYDIKNLTVHNLAIKNASSLNKEKYRHKDTLNYKKIYDRIGEVVKNKEMFPYYMYRQKNSFQWGENLGYSKKGAESVYNIEMIEENKTIIGIGAGAVTKLIWSDPEKGKDNIRRLINPKDPLVWIDELERRIENKKNELRILFKG